MPEFSEEDKPTPSYGAPTSSPGTLDPQDLRKEVGAEIFAPSTICPFLGALHRTGPDPFPPAHLSGGMR